jgi:DNA-binding MarR family transcriptional regulator
MEKNLDSNQLKALLAGLQSLDADISMPLLVTLIAVGESPGLSIGELAEKIDAPQQSASRYIAILMGRYQSPGETQPLRANRPLLKVEISPDDPRRRSILLTDHGTATLKNFLTKISKR